MEYSAKTNFWSFAKDGQGNGPNSSISAQGHHFRAPEQIQAQLFANFPDVLPDQLSNKMRVKGDPIKICFKEGISPKPIKIFTTRPVPLHMKVATDQLIEDLLQKGVIDRLPPNTVTKDLFRGHFVEKPGGGVRLITDYTPANPYIERPVHPFPAPDITVQSVAADANWFATMDALHSYLQIPLDKSNQALTAFLLPQGRFYYKVAPMGLTPSGDWWCH